MINGRNSKWYRRQCSLYSVRLGEWLMANHGRLTKARKAIVEAEKELARNFKNEEEAYQALLAVEEMAWSAPVSAFKVIHKAIRPSEKFNEFWQRPSKQFGAPEG